MNEEKYILETLIENMEEGVHIVNKEGKTLYYNSSMMHIEGLDKSYVVGRNIKEVFNLNDETSSLLKTLKNPATTKNLNQKYNNFNGKEITTTNITFPVLNDGEVIASVEISKDLTSMKRLNEEIINLRENRHYTFSSIVTMDENMKKEIEKAVKASRTKASVLICGETGTGKEMFAQSIHYDGIRSDKPFVAINCAAIPTGLLESILFGTSKGIYTGAENKKGLLEEVNGGTLLLDEINSMDTVLQSKLLRFLQENYIRPLGGNKDIPIDVRIIATLNEEPDKLIGDGCLRKDLYYRLGVFKIEVPPLRMRKGDIIPLSKYFLSYYSKMLGKNILGFSEEVMEKFLEYSWPGNIRELKNMIEYAVTMADYGSKEKITLTLNEFEDRIKNRLFLNGNNKNSNINYSTSNFSLSKYLEDIEKDIIIKYFHKNNKNISKTSKDLKISRQNLQYKLKKYGIKE